MPDGNGNPLHVDGSGIAAVASTPKRKKEQAERVLSPTSVLHGDFWMGFA